MHFLHLPRIGTNEQNRKGAHLSMEQTVVNHAIKEDLTHFNQMFPLSEFVDHFDTFAAQTFPSHWHHELELSIILHGSAEYNVNGTPYTVGEGCAIYLAPEAVHMGRALEKGTVGYNIVLLPQFLSAPLRDINCEKYTLPLEARWPDAFVITPARKEGHAILEHLTKMYYTESSGFAYELFLLEKLVGIWRNLLAILPRHMTPPADSGKAQREQRMRVMLDFIRQNYAQPLTIHEIAAAASISKSEVFRCFSELSKTTPVEYINKVRLLQAAQLLITTEDSISDICYTTGFNSTSYFSKKFNEHYGMTPKAYRIKNRS